jgi:hypothetical protein
MNDKAGIWIDHKRAVIVSVSAGRVTTKTLESEVGAHPRYSSQQDGRGEKKYEERHGERLDQYYDEVVSQLGQPKALLIFGPGEAKLELKERLRRSKTLSGRTVDIETVDKLTDPQIVAKGEGGLPDRSLSRLRLGLEVGTSNRRVPRNLFESVVP